jgi:hypothetical protein
MTKHVTQLGGVAATLLALAAPAAAEIKLNENFSVAGYAAGSYRRYDESTTDKFDVDAAKVSFLTNFAPVTGHASVFYTPGGSPDETTLLDVYATYDAGGGVSITGGKFLSWLGFEAFDIPNMYQITYANGDWLAPIPGYHSGLKLNYSEGAWSGGVALLDSIYGGLKGDGELRSNAGYEAYISFTGIEKLTLWLGGAMQTEGAFTRNTAGRKVYASSAAEEVFTLNFWASYQVTESLLLAGEYVTKDSYTMDGYNWLLFANWAFDEKIATTFRVSGEDIDNGPSFTKLTVAPSFKVTENLSVRLEVSLYDYKDNGPVDNDTFLGVQGVFKF